MLVSGRVYPTKPPSHWEWPGAYSVSVRRLEGPSGDAMELGKTLRLASCRAMMEGWRRGRSWQIGMGATCFLEKKWEMYAMYHKKTHKKGDVVGEWSFLKMGVQWCTCWKYYKNKLKWVVYKIYKMVVLTHPGLTCVDMKDEFLKGSPFFTRHRIQNDQPKRKSNVTAHLY